jgi:opacity protein-like surface antigen
MKEGAPAARRHAAICALALVLTVPALATPAAAQRDWNRTDDPLKESLGLHAGKIGGVGLAYKYPIRWWFYLQLAGGIWHTSDDKRHNVGGELQYVLRQDDRLRLFAAVGAGYFYHKEYEDGPGDTRTASVKDHWNTGFGIGVEYLKTDRIALQLEGDFTHEGDDDDVIFLPQVAVFLYF